MNTMCTCKAEEALSTMGQSKQAHSPIGMCSTTTRNLHMSDTTRLHEPKLKHRQPKDIFGGSGLV